MSEDPQSEQAPNTEGDDGSSSDAEEQGKGSAAPVLGRPTNPLSRPTDAIQRPGFRNPANNRSKAQKKKPGGRR